MADAFHKLCVDSAVAILKGLALPRIDQNIVTQLLEGVDQLDQPVIVATIEDDAVGVMALTSSVRLVEYPVKLKVMDRVPVPADASLPEWTLWQEKILDAFPDRKLSTYPEGTIGVKVTNRRVIRKSGHQLAEGEWVLMFRAVRPN